MCMCAVYGCVGKCTGHAKSLVHTYVRVYARIAGLYLRKFERARASRGSGVVLVKKFERQI